MRRMFLGMLATTMLACAAQSASAADTVVVQWNDVTLQAIRDTKPGPPIVSRMLAVVDTCMYDAWSAYNRRAAPTRGVGIGKRPKSPTTADDKAKAVSFAAFRAIVDLFPSSTANANALMATLGYDPMDTSTDVTTPSGIGNVACRAVLDYRHHDGSNQLGDLNGGAPYSDYTGYVPANTPMEINDPNRWQPQIISDGNGGTRVQTYVGVFWGQVLPFNPRLRIPVTEGPDVYPGRDYTQGVDSILKYSAELTDTTKTIAEYWADGPKSETPAGHWALFAKFVSQRDGHTLGQDVRMFFAESNALMDAGIVGWGIKRQYDAERPVTAVHFLKAGQQVSAWAGPFLGTQLIDGTSWRPYQPPTVVTPPFAEYLSGHSIFSGSGAEILHRFTGSDRFGASFVQPAGGSRVEPGVTPAVAVTLGWRTFNEAANQAGISRRYGGIHFIPGDLDGRALGHRLGARSWRLAVAYFEGHPNDYDEGDRD